MMEKILQLLALRCSHKHLSKPFTAGAQPARGEWEEIGSEPGHYVVCLDCGKKFAYDWATMRMVR